MLGVAREHGRMDGVTTGGGMTSLNDHHLPAEPPTAAEDDGSAEIIRSRSIRDDFAMAALQGYRAANVWQLSADLTAHPSERNRFATSESVARWSYDDADAMLKERNK
jgi:hypothetical protein